MNQPNTPGSNSLTDEFERLKSEILAEEAILFQKRRLLAKRKKAFELLWKSFTGSGAAWNTRSIMGTDRAPHGSLREKMNSALKRIYRESFTVDDFAAALKEIDPTLKVFSSKSNLSRFLRNATAEGRAELILKGKPGCPSRFRIVKASAQSDG